MKYLLINFLFLATFNLSAQSAEDIERYFTFFNNQHIAVNNLAMQYLQYSVHSTDMALIENKRQSVIEQLNKSIQEVEAMPTLKDDDQLKPTALEVFRSFLGSFEMDFVEVLQLKANSQSSYESMEAYFQSRKDAEKKVDEAADRYLEAQKAFAEKHDIQLQLAEENQDVQDLNRLNNYHQAIFMRYFKILMRNAEFTEALNTQDATEIAKTRNILLIESEAQLKSLAAMPAFQGESIYKPAAVELITTIRDLAKTDYLTLEQIMHKPGAERTQEDANQFNSIVQGLQTKVMPLNQKANEQGNELLKKYVPKPRMTQRL
ncbi:MAG: hypothetical protein AAGI23_15435 [Bacteroidota bacterium]